MNEDIKKIIEEEDIKAFKETFDNPEGIKNFLGENDKNILHFLGENASIDFFKNAYRHLQRIDKEYTKSLLLKRDANDVLPANKEFATPDEKMEVIAAIGKIDKFPHQEMTAIEARRNEVYKFLKRETKQAMNKEKNDLFHYGAEFSQTIPGTDHYLPNSEFYFQVAYYPTVRLFTNIENNDEDKRKRGLNQSDKNDTSFVNFYKTEIVENYIEEYDEVLHDKQITKGEFVSLDYIPITERSLGSVAAEMLDFPEDFTKSLAMLNSIGDTIKIGLKDDMLQPIFRNLIQKSGVVIADDNQDISYFGLCEFKEHNDVDEYNVLSVFPSSPEEVANTTNHEMTHASDYNFSDGSLMKAYVTLMAGDNDIPHKIKDIFDHHAHSYEGREFSSEALAEINAVIKNKDLDPMTSEIFKAFSKYATSGANRKDDLSEFIEEASEFFRNKDEIMALYNDKLVPKIDDKTKYNYASSADKKRIKEKFIPEFIEDIKKINIAIDEAINASYTKDELEKEALLQKNMSFLPSTKEVNAVFNETLSDASGKSVPDMTKMLKSALSDYQEKDASKLQLFKIALLATKLKKQAFPKENLEIYDVNYEKATDFEKIAMSDFKKTGLLRFANKLSYCLETQENDKSVSKEAILIAVNTIAKPKKVQDVIDDVTKSFEGKNKSEAMFTFKKEMQENEKQTVYDIVRLVKTAELTANVLGSSQSHFQNLDYSEFDKSLSKTPITKNKKFNSALKKLADTPLLSNFSKKVKNMESGANNLRAPNNIRLFKQMAKFSR